jgi:hypothetical protein
MSENETFIRMSDPEAGEMLRKIATDEKRSMGQQNAVLIRQEYARRYSTPQPVVTVAEAQAAAERQA